VVSILARDLFSSLNFGTRPTFWATYCHAKYLKRLKKLIVVFEVRLDSLDYDTAHVGCDIVLMHYGIVIARLSRAKGGALVISFN
jgi:hypothetical protein